jgi:heme/copper-type cytochrome/quinol oxidase subunit 3
MEGLVIPYTAERRPDTGVSNVTLGIWLFLASEVMLFGALFSAYALLRVSAVEWPGSGRELLGAGKAVTLSGQLFLGTLSVWAALRFPGKSTVLQLRLACGWALLFLLTKGIDYSSLISSGRLPSSSMPLALFFTLTGFHALHVLAGFVANVWVLRGITRVDAAMTAGRLKALALYWSFVDVVWLAILVAVYAR